MYYFISIDLDDDYDLNLGSKYIRFYTDFSLPPLEKRFSLEFGRK